MTHTQTFIELDVKGVTYTDYEGWYGIWSHAKTREKAVAQFEKWLTLNAQNAEGDMKDLAETRVWYCKDCNFYTSGDSMCCECGEEHRSAGRKTWQLEVKVKKHD